MSELFYGYYNSPIGYLEVVTSDTVLLKCNFIEREKTSSKNSPRIMNDALKQLESYFDGTLLEFSLNLELSGTDFQKEVWKKLQKIPFGRTITYKELADKVGKKKAIRAVGSANGRNPISIIIPCHRVIGSDGKLRGYGGGIEKKKWLLDFESKASFLL